MKIFWGKFQVNKFIIYSLYCCNLNWNLNLIVSKENDVISKILTLHQEFCHLLLSFHRSQEFGFGST